MISNIELRDFKRVKKFETDLGKINILVGANNSGKSSVLQGIQFTIMAEVVRRKLDRRTVSQEQLLYLPTVDFSVLRHDSPYTNYSGATSTLKLISDEIRADGSGNDTFTIELSKGRNYGNISINTIGYNKFRQQVTTYKELYSAYTPGLSGIPFSERLVGRAVLRKAAANGDANLYLRNIIYYIKVDKKLEELNKLIKQVFPNTAITINFEPDDDIDIGINVFSGGKTLPLELCGTGVLQVIQIMAYSVYFKPKLFLLDEPDEHLHPNNQTLLCKALKLLSQDLGIQILLSTHSRHIISAFEGDAKFIWMKDGGICKDEFSSNYYNILSDLGALDTFDEVIKGTYTTVVLTEDKDKKYINLLIKANGFDLSKTLIYSYGGCSQIEAAIQVGNFIRDSARNCKIIIHRDRDFMTEDEVQVIRKKVLDESFLFWITKGSDIESYYVTPQHISILTGKTEAEVSYWLNEIIKENHIEIQHDFESKRQDIKHRMYFDNKLKSNSAIPYPSFQALFGRNVPTSIANVKGKFLIRKVNDKMILFAGEQVDLLQPSVALQDGDIATLNN